VLPYVRFYIIGILIGIIFIFMCMDKILLGLGKVSFVFRKEESKRDECTKMKYFKLQYAMLYILI